MKNIKLFESFNENEEPGQEIAPNQAEYPMLSISFGLDQTDAVDSVLEDLKKEGHIRGLDKKVEDDMAHYLLKFDSVYGVYLFGHNQAKSKY